jgi:two-component system LytT family response regulator
MRLGPALLQSAATMIGRDFGPYHVLAELGRGGMGVVYRARDTRLRREVALKVLSPTLMGDAAFQRRLLHEARTAAALNHPAVCVIHEVGEAEGVAFVAMELLRGEVLAQRLTAGPVPLAQALDWALQIAEGLAAGHAAGIVHRDIKPGNVMLTDSGHAKVIDFGLAKSSATRTPLDSGLDTPPRGDTDPGRLVGTAAYMSPEQARGQAVDARSDVFAFGALLHEMLAGRAAFLRESGIETLHAVLKEAPGPLPESVPTDLRRLLESCLAKDPARRPADGAELSARLRALPALNVASFDVVSGDTPGPSNVVGASAPPAPRLRVALVDDEDPARALLREYLSEHGDVDIVAECRNGFEAVKAVAETRPDLLFLDVQMPKLDGFEVLDLVGRDVAVVFVTAFDEHALRAFEVHAVDYLLKPVAPERFALALARARARRRSGLPVPAPDALLADARPRERPVDRVLVRQGARVHVISATELDYAEAQDDYVGLRSGGKLHLKQQTLGDLEATLDPARFVRIHRSYLLNLDRLARLESEGKDQRVAVLRDGTRLPVSRSGYARLKQLL